MSTFDSTLARMQELCYYGRVNENKQSANNGIEHHTTGADGREYGIIRENGRFFIKSAPKGRGLVVEDYDYIGGILNKKHYQYNSYMDALKNFDLKMRSLNEAYNGHVNTESLDPYRKCDTLNEQTSAMSDQLARMRQIMHNTAMIMKESSPFASSAPIKNQPEAAKGHSGDKDTPFVNDGKTDTLNHKPQTAADPKSQGSPFGDKKEYAKEGEQVNVAGSVAGKKAKLNEDLSTKTSFDDGLEPFPSTGSGEADTEEHNKPFTQTVSESCDEENEVDPTVLDSEEPDVDDDDLTISDEDLDTDEPSDEDLEPEDLSDDESETEPEDNDVTDDDFEDDDEPEDGEDNDVTDDDFEDDDEPEDEDSDLKSEIEMLKQQIADLKAQINGSEETDETDEDDFEFAPDSEDDSDYEDDLNEGKANRADKIIESVCNKYLGKVNEDELHDFGKHPGYRKQPFTLPPTGKDSDEHGRDWNDDSVYSERPFGEKVGDSTPFDDLVKKVTKDIMESICSGEPVCHKKKVK